MASKLFYPVGQNKEVNLGLLFCMNLKPDCFQLTTFAIAFNSFMQQVNAKKGLGQHFLTDKNIARKIVDSIQPDSYATLIEVGPGTGVLTQHLLNTPNFKAIELDQESIDYLNKTYPEHTDQFIHADFLRHPVDQYPSPIAIIGNFPYYISSQILFKVLENRSLVNQVVCMIQKEVAERIAAKHGNKTYGIMSVLLQAYYQIEYLFTVHENCFSPPPKVKSAVIRLRRNNTAELNCNPELFFKIVKTTFNQRRKMIRNSLQQNFEHIPEGHELMQKRPEQLTVEQFVELTNLVGSINQ
jgi:16S rRNA (adenine1518-N6/adenine1519-N6)-dimethyltransferase